MSRDLIRHITIDLTVVGVLVLVGLIASGALSL